MNKRKKKLIINGSLRGNAGNSGAITRRAESFIKSQDALPCIVTLSEPMENIGKVKDLLLDHDGFLIVSGTYWNSWGSPLQRFIEVVTPLENTPVFFGKPVSCVVSMDSVGGIEVAARIHCVFSQFGCWTPPCSTLVLSRVGQEAVEATKGEEEDPNEDVWRLDDIEIVLRNLIASTRMDGQWEKWPNAEFKIEDGPWPSTGPIDMESPKFLNYP
jgi:chromate reductase